MLLRDDQQAALAELQATAAGLVMRYRSLIEGDIDPALRSVLSDVVASRTQLIDALAECARERGDQPTAADLELNEYRALGDRLAAWAVGDELPLNRVSEAEQFWIERVRDLGGLEWRDAERRLIERLDVEALGALQRLRALRG